MRLECSNVRTILLVWRRPTNWLGGVRHYDIGVYEIVLACDICILFTVACDIRMDLTIYYGRVGVSLRVWCFLECFYCIWFFCNMKVK